MYANYAWPVDWCGGAARSAYLRVQWSFTGDMLNIFEPICGQGEVLLTCAPTEDNPAPWSDGPSPQIRQSSYNIGDIKFGVEGDDWTVQLFVNNLTDERAVLFANSYEFDYFFGGGRETVNRPREAGIRFTKSFNR